MGELRRMCASHTQDGGADVMLVNVALSQNMTFYDVRNMFKHKMDGKAIHAFGGHGTIMQVYDNSAQFWREGRDSWESLPFKAEEIDENTVRITASMGLRIRLILVKYE